MKAIIEYFKNSLHEIKIVTWPTEAETIRLTKITIIFLVLFTFMFFISDTVLGSFFKAVYSNVTR